MQPGWLKEYFKPQDDGAGEHAVDDRSETPRCGDVSRRDFVASGFVAGVAAGMAAGSVAGEVARAEAQTANPLATRWWPGPWGAQDQRGANNRMTPAKVMEAARLIKTGKVYQLGRVLEKGIPLFGERFGAHLVLPGTPTGGPFGKHNLYYHDELFVGEIGQIGSQFDGLGHIGMVAAGRGRQRLRPQEARHRTPEAVLHPGPPPRRPRSQGRRSLADRLRDHDERRARHVAAPGHPRAW